VVVYSQDLGQGTRNPEAGISTRLDVLALAIHNVALCSWGRSNPILFYVSTTPAAYRIQKTDRRTLFQSLLASAADVRRKGKLPKLPAGLLSVIGGSIVTAITFAVSQEPYASKTAQRQRGLFEYQTSQSLIEALLLGLAATILLLILEVSLRSLLK